MRFVTGCVPEATVNQREAEPSPLHSQEPISLLLGDQLLQLGLSRGRSGVSSNAAHRRSILERDVELEG